MARRKLKVDSLFAGVGGMCMGFKNAGMKVVWANEYDAKGCQTYRHNFPKAKLL
jgi:DNA (cytosine-5)-methyltransferase 1